jgi:hypothetical protein
MIKLELTKEQAFIISNLVDVAVAREREAAQYAGIPLLLTHTQLKELDNYLKQVIYGS